MSHEQCKGHAIIDTPESRITAYTWVTNYVAVHVSHKLCERVTKTYVIIIPSCVHVSHELCDYICVRMYTVYTWILTKISTYSPCSVYCNLDVSWNILLDTIFLQMSHELWYLYWRRVLQCMPPRVAACCSAATWCGVRYRVLLHYVAVCYGTCDLVYSTEYIFVKTDGYIWGLLEATPNEHNKTFIHVSRYMYICVPWCVCATHYTIIQTRYIDVCALLDMYELCACIWVTKQVTWYISHELCEWRAMCVYTSRGHCDFKCESPSKWATNMSYLIRNPNYVRICESRTMWLYIWVTNYTK